MVKNIILGKIIGKGRRGVVRRCVFSGNNYVAKVPNPKSDTIRRIENESCWLKKLNIFNIGPKFVFCDENVLVMEYLDGEHLCDFLKTCDEKSERKVLKKIMLQCRVMDKLKVNKFEMHRITKNAIVIRGDPILIDFEKCKIVLEPKNVTQFCQFLLKRGYGNKTKCLKLLKNYKNNQTERNFISLKKFFF
jgi:putative serine/threonine protein kinase